MKQPNVGGRPVGASVVTKYCVNCGVILFFTKGDHFTQYQCCGFMTNAERRSYTCFKGPFCEMCSKPENHRCIKWLQRIKRQAPI